MSVSLAVSTRVPMVLIAGPCGSRGVGRAVFAVSNPLSKVARYSATSAATSSSVTTPFWISRSP